MIGHREDSNGRHELSLSFLSLYIPLPLPISLTNLSSLFSPMANHHLKLASFLLLLLNFTTLINAQLSRNFYSKTCPNVESIVKQAVTAKFQQTFVTVPATLRLFFHDCMVQVKKSTLWFVCFPMLVVGHVWKMFDVLPQWVSGLWCFSDDSINREQQGWERSPG